MGSFCGEGQQTRIKVLQTLSTKCQVLSSKDNKLQRNSRLLQHHRKERSLKCILHLHSMLGRWRAPPLLSSLLTSERIHTEVKMKPTDDSNIQVRYPQPCCSSEVYIDPARTPFPICLTAGSVLSCSSTMEGFHFSATIFCSFFLCPSLKLYNTLKISFESVFLFTILFSSPPLSFNENIRNYVLCNNLESLFLLQSTLVFRSSKYTILFLWN